MIFEKLLNHKNNTLNTQKPFLPNSFCDCNCCSCICPNCQCCCKCKCHQESKRIEKEKNNKSYENYSFKPNKNFSLTQSLENLHLNDDNNKLNGNFSLKNFPINRNVEMNNLNQGLFSYKEKTDKYIYPLAPNNSFNKRNYNPTKLIKNIYNNENREKAKMEFINLLNSMKDSDDNLNNENDNNLKSPFFPKQSNSIENCQKNYKKVYSYNGNRIKDENNKRNNSISYYNLTENNNDYNNPFQNKINNDISLSSEKKLFSYENKNNPIKPYINNKLNNLYKNVSKNQRNKNEQKYYNSHIQKFSFQFIHKKDIIQKLKDENQKLKKELEKKNKRNDNLNQQISNLQNDLNGLLYENSNLQQLFMKFDKNNLNNNQNKNVKKEINYYKNQLSNLAKENLELVKNLENLQSDFINLENENKTLKNKMNNWKKQMENLNKLENKNLIKNQGYVNNNFIPYKETNKILKNKNTNIKNLKYNNEELEKETENSMDLILKYKKNISSLKEENEKLKNQNLNAQQSLKELIEENKGLNNQNLNNQKEILLLRQENNNLLNQINNLPTESSIIENINKSKFKNKIPIKLFKDLSVKTGSRINYKGNSTISNYNNTNDNINYLNDSYKKITTSTTKQIISSSSSISKIINKFKIENDLSISPIKQLQNKFITNIDNLGDNLVFKIYSDKNILCYDFTNNNFGLFDFADYTNFESNFIKEENNGNIYLSYNSILYIVTGKNSDFFYRFSPQKKSMEKLCSLNNNHSKGSLIPFNNSIICLSGEHNKKCEIYSIHKNEWYELPEMNFERSEFATCIIKNRFLFSIFGFNSPKNEYLNNIEFFDLLSEGSLWKNLDYKSDNFSLYIKGLLALNYFDNKIILIGGFNGEYNKPVEYFSQIILGEDFENKIFVEKVDRKLKDIQKYKSYIFSNGVIQSNDYKGRIYNIAFDNDDRIHIFQMQNMVHDVFPFE